MITASKTKQPWGVKGSSEPMTLKGWRSRGLFKLGAGGHDCGAGCVLGPRPGLEDCSSAGGHNCGFELGVDWVRDQDCGRFTDHAWSSLLHNPFPVHTDDSISKNPLQQKSLVQTR